MTRDGKLSIVILTKYPKRAIEILDLLEVYEWLNSTVKLDIVNRRLYSNNVIYEWIKPTQCDGVSADQVILDHSEGNMELAKLMLMNSCVPEYYQIIDDRDVLMGVFR